MSEIDLSLLRWEETRPMGRREPGARLMIGDTVLVRVSHYAPSASQRPGEPCGWRWYVPNGRPMGLATFRTSQNICDTREEAMRAAERFARRRLSEREEETP